MTIEEIIVILQNKVTGLRGSRSALVQQGNLRAIIDIDNDILSTEGTLEKLKSLN
jgi:hypothetical protein